MPGPIGSVLVVMAAVVTAVVAASRGRSGALWFVLGAFFPVVSLVVVLLLRPREVSASG